MKHQQFILAVSFVAVLSVGMIQACGYQSDTASVTINLGHQQQAALEKTSIFDRFLAFITLSTRLEAEPPAFPQSIYAILLSVSGPGMTGIERSFARSEIDNGRITLSVPAGDARTFAVVALVPGQFEYPSRTYGGISTVALAPVADAYVENGDKATNNYGTSSSLVVKHSGGSSLTRESYLRFDLSSETNGLLLDASLRLTYTTCNQSDTQAVSRVTDTRWTEPDLVWTNKPASGPEQARWNVYTNVPRQTTAAVGAAARAAVGGLLDLRVTALGGAYVSYASRENGAVGNRPALILTRAHPPPAVSLTAPAPDTAW